MKTITLRLAALSLLLTPLAALRADDDGPIVGAIRWDGWYGDATVTKAVEASLGQPKYYFRLPWFAQLQSDWKVLRASPARSGLPSDEMIQPRLHLGGCYEKRESQ